MPSKLPRVSFVISDEELEQVKEYQKAHKLKSISKAVLAMIEEGLKKEEGRIAEQEEKKEQPADGGELSEIETEFFTVFQNLPASHRGLAASLCLALVRELVKHQITGKELEDAVLLGSNR